MVDPSHVPDSRERDGLPRWVKVGGIAVLIVVLLIVVVMLLTGGPGGEHGPSRHGAADEPGRDLSYSSLAGDHVLLGGRR